MDKTGNYLKHSSNISKLNLSIYNTAGLNKALNRKILILNRVKPLKSSFHGLKPQTLQILT